MKKILIAAALATVAAPAMASNFLDARFAGSESEVELPFDLATANGFQDMKTKDASGFALRAQADLLPNLFARVNYVSTSADQIDVDGTTYDANVDESFLRTGLGLQASNDFLRYYGAVEYVRSKLDIEGESGSDDGFTIAGGLSDTGKSRFLWNVEMGYVKIGEADGGLFSFDIGFRLESRMR